MGVTHKRRNVRKISVYAKVFNFKIGNKHALWMHTRCTYILDNNTKQMEKD